MKKLNFSYEVNYSFSEPVSAHSFALHILPVTDAEQGVYACEYRVSAVFRSGGDGQQRREITTCGVADDGFGSRVVSGRIEEPHDAFSFCVTGKAYTDRQVPRKWEKHPAYMYRFSTELTRPGKRIWELFQGSRERIHREAVGEAAGGSIPGGEERIRAEAWMHLLSGVFSYRPGSTDIHTAAEEALEGGEGVCQDFAQILITLLRLDGIPARYIVGMLLGEGETHAWCEAWCGEYWIGLDPTHDRPVDENYIQIAAGRDYADCIMDRGIFRGHAVQTQQVSAKVTENTVTPVRKWDLI